MAGIEQHPYAGPQLAFDRCLPTSCVLPNLQRIVFACTHAHVMADLSKHQHLQFSTYSSVLGILGSKPAALHNIRSKQ